MVNVDVIMSTHLFLEYIGYVETKNWSRQISMRFNFYSLKIKQLQPMV